MLTTKLEDFVEKTKQKKLDKQLHPKVRHRGFKRIKGCGEGSVH